MLEALLAKGIPVEAVTAGAGQTALMVSASKGQVETAKILIRCRADIFAEDRHHETVLIYAFKHNKISMLSFLINQGADVECRDSSGRTLLMLAAAQGDPRMVSALMYEGADPEVNFAGGTALLVATRLERPRSMPNRILHLSLSVYTLPSDRS